MASIVESPSTLGVADSSLYNLDQTDLQHQLRVLKDAGVTDLRIGVPWAFVQPDSATTYDWSKMDAVVDTANAMGFSLVASITSNPKWDGVPVVGAPNAAAYATFTGEVAQRYSGKISAYEVWNEPNGAVFYSPVSPESYTAVLKAAYTAIKAADPNAEVVGGVLGAGRTIPGISMSAPDFLKRMYAAGAEGYFDALSYHPYSFTLPFSQGGSTPDAPLEQIQRLRALMDANGDTALKIWATEYGNPTTGPFGISEKQQAQFLHDFVSAWQSVEGAGPSFIYSTRDLDTGAWNAEDNYGLWHTNWTPKAAADMLTELEQELKDGTLEPYVAPKLSLIEDAYLHTFASCHVPYAGHRASGLEKRCVLYIGANSAELPFLPLSPT